ncbi:MAG: hypothetical protein Q4C53_06755 [Clostridia bacterium]|nr:hypothetical protein [Clostridia bacterium]
METKSSPEATPEEQSKGMPERAEGMRGATDVGEANIESVSPQVTEGIRHINESGAAKQTEGIRHIIEQRLSAQHPKQLHPHPLGNKVFPATGETILSQERTVAHAH